MSLYMQPDPPLTEEEKLLSAVIGLDHHIPVGFQIGMPMHLDRAIAETEQLFTEHKLPLREELIAELTVWRAHAQDGLKFADRCDQLMRVVIRKVDDDATGAGGRGGTPGPARKR